MPKKKEPEFDLHRCSLPDLALEVARRFKLLEDNSGYAYCNCDDYCYHNPEKTVEPSDMINLEVVINEFVRRMK